MEAISAQSSEIITPSASQNDSSEVTAINLTSPEDSNPSLSETLESPPSSTISLPLSDPPSFESPLFQLFQSSTKGGHYIASILIPRGTIIIRETPKFSISDSQIPEVFRVQNGDRLWYAAFIFSVNKNPQFHHLLSKYSLPSFFYDKINRIPDMPDEFYEYYYKLLTHAYDIESFNYQDQCTKSGLYEISSFFNHSCHPNCKHRFNLQNNELIVIANEDIPAGTELTIGYMGPQPKGCPNEVWLTTVKKSFQQKYGESCKCSYCTS